jgi:imidazolonepropionase-like amidohydrolase
LRKDRLFGAFIAATLAVPAAPALPPDSGSVVLRCGALIDGVSASAVGPAVVVIEHGRITAVRPDAIAPGGIRVIDLAGYTCLPGLIDMHTHLTMRPEESLDLSENYRRTDQQQAAISREHARRTLLAGFTTVRDVGSYAAWADRAIRDEIDRGETPGPRMQVAGIYLTIPGGGGDLVIPGHPESEIPARLRAGVARGPEQFRQKAEIAVAGGADLLKVIASGAVFAYGGKPGEPEMTPEEIAAVAKVAHSHGLKLVAHAHGARSIREAILAGADTIEHASLIDAETIELARQHQVALSMDVYNGDYTDTEGRRQGYPEEFLRKNTETTEAQRQGFTAALEAGVPIVYGTDACIYPHGLNARQFPIMVERGMTPMEAIQSATSVAAKFMGWSDRVGSIVSGRYGDVIAVKGDPLQDIRRLQDVAVVVKGGIVVR